MSKVDAKLNKVYDYIQKFIDENGFPPTVREIKNALNITSTSLVYSYIKKLTAEGRLEKQSNKNRAIGISNSRLRYSAVPMVGAISAGKGILAVENIEEYFPLPEKLFGSGELFMLRVVGNSMVEVGIANADAVVVRKCSTAQNGEIVVALMEDIATVKRFFKEDDRIILHPENSSMTDIIIEENTPIEILGVVVGCIKQFD